MPENPFSGRRVLLTGHSGFKGSWLARWLLRLDAKLLGYSLPAPTTPSHFNLLKLDFESVEGDLRDGETLRKTFARFQPELVLHLAAQPLVRLSYEQPVETFETNVMGTVKVLDACRTCPSVKAVVVVSSDKCYENREWPWGYRENDALGGHDPYSASKGCTELVAASFRKSFLEGKGVLLASARAGNVIGGGDWAYDRLIPDLMRAASKGVKAELRNPDSTRPWQHVLEPLSGYLLLSSKLLAGDASAASAWNFGPDDDGSLTVRRLAGMAAELWTAVKPVMAPPAPAPHEAGLLKLDCSKAKSLLAWRPVWDAQTALSKTVTWYKDYYATQQLNTDSDLDSFLKDAKEKGLEWTRALTPQS